MRQRTRFFRCGLSLHLITVATEWRLSRSTAKHHRLMKIPDFTYIFTKKWRNFQGLYFFFFISTDFPCFHGPVRAMCQSVGKCFRMHLRAASIYKCSGGLGCPLTPARFFGARLATRPIRWHFRLVRTLAYITCLTLNPYTTEARFYVLNAIAFST